MKYIPLPTGPNERAQRIVECCCALPSCSAKFDGLVQSCDEYTGVWFPDVEPGLAAVGWIEAHGHVFCGVHHSKLYAHGHGIIAAVVPVTTIKDASYKATHAGRQAPKPLAQPVRR